jgi:hypothetical protein
MLGAFGMAMIGSVRRSRHVWRKASLLYPVSAGGTAKRRQGRPGRSAIGGQSAEQMPFQ